MATFVAEGQVEFQPHHHRIGPAPDEIILQYVVAAGSFRGPSIELTAIANYGAEWATVRGDGVIAFESKQVLRTPASDLVCATLSGVYDVGDDGYVDALDDILSSKVPAEFSIRFFTGAIDYRWLNRKLLVGQGERDFAMHRFGLRIFTLENRNALDC